jgi:hypothetical protein
MRVGLFVGIALLNSFQHYIPRCPTAMLPLRTALVATKTLGATVMVGAQTINNQLKAVAAMVTLTATMTATTTNENKNKGNGGSGVSLAAAWRWRRRQHSSGSSSESGHFYFLNGGSLFCSENQVAHFF